MRDKCLRHVLLSRFGLEKELASFRFDGAEKS